MRLGQLARKHDIPVQEMIDFLEEEIGEKLHANAKLFDVIEEKLYKKFDLHPADETPEVVEEAITESDEEVTLQEVEIEKPIEPKAAPPIPLTPEEDIALADGELAYPHEKPIQTSPKIEEEQKAPINDDEIIQSDKLLEMLESEELPADLERVKLIKAPKKKLSGLKVLDKIEIPEDPRKKAKEKAELEKKEQQEARSKRPQLSEEEKEKRRLKAKRKQEAYEAREEKRRKAQEAEQQKKLKQKHYQQKLQKTQEPKVKKLTKSEPQPASTSRPKETAQPPKTWLGKWWKWMNT